MATNQLGLFGDSPGVKPALRQGPVSDFTGGLLSADEATRAVSGRTLGCVGVLFHKRRTVLCRECHAALIAGTERFIPEQFVGHGYLAVIYGCEGRKPNVERACELCADPVRGEVAGLS